MGILLQQTSQGSFAIPSCSGLSLAAIVGGTKLVSGGTPGDIESRITIRPEALEAGVFMRTEPGDLPLTWQAGTWIVRLNVVDSDMDITLEEVHICRLDNNFNTLATVGKSPDLDISLGSVGVKIVEINGSLQNGSVGDVAYIICGFKNRRKMHDQHFGVIFNQLVDTPII